MGSRAMMNHCLNVIEQMPSGAHAVAEWFDTLNDGAFDSVCTSAIVLTLEDSKADNGFISVRDAATMLAAMRKRYRKIIAMPAIRKQMKPGSRSALNLKYNRRRHAA